MSNPTSTAIGQPSVSPDAKPDGDELHRQLSVALETGAIEEALRLMSALRPIIINIHSGKLDLPKIPGGVPIAIPCLFTFAAENAHEKPLRDFSHRLKATATDVDTRVRASGLAHADHGWSAG